MNEQARRSFPPNRVRYPTDRQFASGCSPPRLGADAVTFSCGAVAYSGMDFHHAVVAPSRAHSFRHMPESRWFFVFGLKMTVSGFASLIMLRFRSTAKERFETSE